MRKKAQIFWGGSAKIVGSFNVLCLICGLFFFERNTGKKCL